MEPGEGQVNCPKRCLNDVNHRLNTYKSLTYIMQTYRYRSVDQLHMTFKANARCYMKFDWEKDRANQIYPLLTSS